MCPNVRFMDDIYLFDTRSGVLIEDYQTVQKLLARKLSRSTPRSRDPLRGHSDDPS